MQFINNQYKIAGITQEDKYGNTFVVEDVRKGNAKKYLRVIVLKKETQDFIEYMKYNFYDYSNTIHPNLAYFNFFNKITLIDNKPITSNKYYYTYAYFEGKKLFEYIKDLDTSKTEDFNTLLDLAAQLLSLIKFMHLRGFLLCNINLNELFIVEEAGKKILKVATLFFPENTKREVILDKDNGYFKSPQVFEYGKYTYASDIYLIGILLFHIFTGINIEDSSYRENLSAFYPQDSASVEILKIITKCTELNVQDRFDSVEKIGLAINKAFNTKFNFIPVEHIEMMPRYRIKLIGRYEQINTIIGHVKNYLYEGKNTRIDIITSPNNNSRISFLKGLEFRIEQEGLLVLNKVPDNKADNSFQFISIVIKDILKYADKELLEKYEEDIKAITSDQLMAGVAGESSSAHNDESKMRYVYRLGNFLIEAAETMHMVLIIDCNAHMDNESIEVIKYLLNHESKNYIYLVCAIEIEHLNENKNVKKLYDVLVDTKQSELMELVNLNLNETAEYIRLILGMDGAPLDFSANIYKHTEGNPDMIYEIIHILFNNHKIFVGMDGRWVLDKVDFENLSFSANIDQIVWNRVNKLDSQSQRVLHIISIFNSAVSSDILEEIMNIERSELYNILNYLAYINILMRKVDDWGISYDYSSINLKKSIYEDIPEKEKFEYHYQASFILEEKFVKENRENRDEMIFHLTKANRKKEAIDHLFSSAEKMIANNLTGQAIKFLEQTCALFPQEEVSIKRIIVSMKLGELYERTGKFTQSIDVYTAVEALAEKTNNDRILANVWIKKFALLYSLNQTKDALRYAIKAKRCIKSTGYLQGLYELTIKLSTIMISRRKYTSYINMAEKMLSEMNQSKYESHYARLLGQYGRAMLYKGRYGDSLDVLLKSSNLLEKLGDSYELASTLLSIGFIYSDFYYDLQKAKEYYEKSLLISQKVNNLRVIEVSYNNLAEMYRLKDRYKEALEYYENAMKSTPITQRRDTEVLVTINLALSNIALSAYSKAEENFKFVEHKLENWIDSGEHIMNLNHAKSEYYYQLGYFQSAAEHAQQAIDMCVTWGIKTNMEAVFNLLRAQIKQTGILDYEREMAFCENVFKENTFKLGRVACYEFAEAFMEAGQPHLAKKFLVLGLSYQNNIETDLLSLMYQYLEALLSEPEEQLIRLLNLISIMDIVENNDLKWKIYKHIAMALYRQNNYQEAVKYLITALNFLRKLVYNVPDMHKVAFINAHGRNSIKESLIRLSGEIMSQKNGLPIDTNIHLLMQTAIVGKRANDPPTQALAVAGFNTQLTLENVDKYFDYTSFRNIYRYKELEFKMEKDLEDNLINSPAGNSFMYKTRAVISGFGSDNIKNLKDITALLAEVTQAKNAFVLTLEEGDNINLLCSYNRYTEIPFYKYIVEQVKQKRDAILVTDAFEYNRKKGEILIPKDITAVFCLPVMTTHPEAKADGIKSGMEYLNKNKQQENDQIIGYIYLDTDSIINSFTEENGRFCEEAAKVAYILVDNYNLKITSSVDKLTKLYTRKYFEMALQNEMRYVEELTAQRETRQLTLSEDLKAGTASPASRELSDGLNKEQFAIIMIDIDKFKTVNDRFGHQKGDEVLQSVSSIIMNTVRAGDICGRYGGEEIIILLPGTDGKSGLIVAEKIRRRIESAKLLGVHTPLTVSLGVASYPEHSIWTKDLIEKADQALYHAKESGRNQSVIYHGNISKTEKRIDKLAGIISGNLVDDQRRVETMLEILELQRNIEMSEKEKLFSFLGRIIEVSEAQTGILFEVKKDGKPGQRIIRKKFIDTEVEEAYYNEALIIKCIANKTGEYLVDWSNYPGMDQVTGMPDWQSNIILPLINMGEVKAVLYLSLSAKYKEFDANQYNFIKTLCDIISSGLDRK